MHKGGEDMMARRQMRFIDSQGCSPPPTFKKSTEELIPAYMSLVVTSSRAISADIVFFYHFESAKQP
jgi:hypothetical protein